jgi:uncharacterized protein
MPPNLKNKIFRDPIHGDLDFGYEGGSAEGQLLRAVIDSPLFQRLRHIRQNGVANMVFPGAEHSRFAHSMGVAWLASQMFDSASQNAGLSNLEEQRLDTVLAALLHDVGHGPFSHTFEEVVTKNKFDHEKMTVRIISEEESDICKKLKKFDPQLPARLIPYRDIHKRVRQSSFGQGMIASIP